MVKLASWNVNSLKIRLDQVLSWLAANDIEMLALQETKITDDNFPEQAFREMGYQVIFSGQKSYNGVAIISRRDHREIITDIPELDDHQRRILATTIGDLRIINIYVPNGSAVGTDKYEYKLNWLEKLTAYIAEQMKCYSKVVVLGDYNIAPADIDVHDPAVWEGGVMVSAAERQAFNELINLGLKDSYRLFAENGKEYSWWDYRAGSFRRNNGLRIDHILLSNELVQCCKAAKIDKEMRRHERPSDHAPVWVELDL